MAYLIPIVLIIVLLSMVVFINYCITRSYKEDAIKERLSYEELEIRYSVKSILEKLRNAQITIDSGKIPNYLTDLDRMTIPGTTEEVKGLLVVPKLITRSVNMYNRDIKLSGRTLKITAPTNDSTSTGTITLNKKELDNFYNHFDALYASYNKHLASIKEKESKKVIDSFINDIT